MAQRDAAFLTTRWSVVARAATPGSPDAREAMAELCRAYWWPLYAYVRRKSGDADGAADIVQGLFVELIEKGRLAHADRERGRFRTWLLAAVSFHLSHERERGGAIRRGGNGCTLSLDPVDADRRWNLASERELDPERLFERSWALQVLERALLQVDKQSASEGGAELFSALKPWLVGEPASSGLRAAAAQLGMTEGAVKVAAHRLRVALREAIRAEVASTLDDPRDVNDEVRALFAALSK